MCAAKGSARAPLSDLSIYLWNKFAVDGCAPGSTGGPSSPIVCCRSKSSTATSHPMILANQLGMEARRTHDT